MSGVEFVVGKHLEITYEESRDLKDLGAHMLQEGRNQERGWFLRYMRAHKRAHVILRTIIERSHAS